MTCPSCRDIGWLSAGRRCECNQEHPALKWARLRLEHAENEHRRNDRLLTETSRAEPIYAAYLQDFAVHTAEITLLNQFIQKLQNP